MYYLENTSLADLCAVRDILKKNYKTDTTVFKDLQKVEKVINHRLAKLFGHTDHKI